jgi:transposase
MSDLMEELAGRLVVGRKRGGRAVYDEQAKAELVAACKLPGASVSSLGAVVRGQREPTQSMAARRW